MAPGLSFANVYNPLAEPTIGYLPFWPLLLGAIYKLYSVVGFGDRFVYYFLIKQPLIVADTALGYLIYKYVRSLRPGASNAIASLWLFSPLTIIISSIWGMFDSLAMVFVIGALLARGGALRPAYEGLAIWIKSIPLIYAIPFAFSDRRWVRNLCLAVGLPVLATLATVFILHWPLAPTFSTLESTANKGGMSMSAFGFIFYLQTLGYVVWPQPLLMVVGYVWIPGLVAATAISYIWFGFDTEEGLVHSLLLCTIAFLLLKAQVNEQYSIYVLALALVDVGAWNPRRRWLYFAITAAAMGYLLVNNVALVRFLAPVYQQAVSLDGQLEVDMGIWRPVLLFAFSLLFSALNLIYGALLLRGGRRSGVNGTAVAEPARVVGVPSDLR